MALGQAISFPAVMLLCCFSDPVASNSDATERDANLLEEPLLPAEENDRVDIEPPEHTVLMDDTTASSSRDSDVWLVCKCRRRESTTESSSHAYGCIPKDRLAPVLISVADLTSGLASGMSIRYFPIFFLDRLHLSPVHVQTMYIVDSMLQACLMKSGHRLSQRLGRCQVTILHKWTGITAMVILIVLSYFCDNASKIVRSLICLTYTIRTGCMNSSSPLTKSLLMDSVPTHERGRWTALESVNMFSWSGSVFLGDILVNVDGLLFNFSITAILQYLVTTPIVLLMMSEYDGDVEVTSRGTDVGNETQNNRTQSIIPTPHTHRRSFGRSFRNAIGLVLVLFSSSTAVARLDCELYVAESTIPNAGLGIFTGAAKEIGDTLGNGDKAIPLVDMNWHGGSYDIDADDIESTDFFNPTQNYVWHGIGMGMDHETESKNDITAFWPGIDAMINCNLGLLNVIKSTPIYDEAGLHRNLHPGAGGITPYDGVPSNVIRSIPAGGELFKHYGDEWFSSRPHFGKIPLSSDYEDILALVTDLEKTMESLELPKHLTSSEFYDAIILPMKGIWNSRTLNALFNFKWSDIETAIAAQDFGVLLQANATRSLEWLDEHGKCIDHIVHGKSTIEGAG